MKIMSTEQSQPEISIVIPAFNESNRILPTLNITHAYFKDKKINFEIIIVDDGSTDNTIGALKNFCIDHDNIIIIEFSKNTGKGAAVRSGVLKSSGKFVLFQDADGATPISEIEKLMPAISDADIAIGSRALDSKDTKVVSVIHRKILGRIFNFIANTFAVPGIADTQCGFKLFKQKAAKDLFSRQTLNGFSFDVEILYLANKLGYIVKEVAVNWVNIPGTKVNVISDGIRMFYEIALIKFLHRNQ